MRFRFIAVEKANYPVTLMCRILNASRSGFYAWNKRPESARSCSDRALVVDIKSAHRASRGNYGSPRVRRALVAQGHTVGRDRVARLMRENGLRGKRRRRFRNTTDSNHTYPVAPNVLERQFTTKQPNAAWAGDITYIWTMEGWLYLAVIIDLYSRRVVGWAMSNRIDQSLTLRALHMALRAREPGPGLIHHTDRGSQYAANAYQRLLKARGTICSMSRKGDCWDNAVAESFFATLKEELIYRGTWPTRASAKAAIAQYIDGFYNVRRRHSTLGFVSPIDFEVLSWEQRLAA